MLLLTNMKLNVTKEPIKAALFTESYKEQLTWRDAATSKILAESNFFEPLSINELTPPGFGGRIYFPTAVGKSFYVLQAGPKPAPSQASRSACLCLKRPSLPTRPFGEIPFMGRPFSLFRS